MFGTTSYSGAYGYDTKYSKFILILLAFIYILTNFIAAKKIDDSIADEEAKSSGWITFTFIIGIIGLIVFAYVMYRVQFDDSIMSSRCY